MGHAYYANYLYWFEQARGAWCRERGFNYSDLEALGYFLPVVEANVKYRGEVKYDQIIDVEVWVPEIRRSSIHFQYEIFNSETRKLLTEGFTWHVLMGTERKAVTIPTEILEMLNREPGSCIQP